MPNERSDSATNKRISVTAAAKPELPGSLPSGAHTLKEVQPNDAYRRCLRQLQRQMLQANAQSYTCIVLMETRRMHQRFFNLLPYYWLLIESLWTLDWAGHDACPPQQLVTGSRVETLFKYRVPSEYRVSRLTVTLLALLRLTA
jgi:hypothetical protein